MGSGPLRDWFGALRGPAARFGLRLAKHLPYWRSCDRLYALLRFVTHHDRLPRRQLSFNDVLFYLKWDGVLEDDLRVLTTDKEFSKYFVAFVLGKDRVVPTIAVLRTGAEIDGFSFPERCFIKGTAASGEAIRVDGSFSDRERIKAWLGHRYYRNKRERNYRTLTPKVIVEPFVFDNPDAVDIKFFVYEGKARIIECDFDRYTRHTRRLHDRNWTDLACSVGKPLSEKTLEKPPCLEEMIEAAERIGAYFSFVRVDMFTDGKDFLVGEITHCHGCADQPFLPPEAERRVSGILFGPSEG